jgi:hypothetical protein
MELGRGTFKGSRNRSPSATRIFLLLVPAARRCLSLRGVALKSPAAVIQPWEAAARDAAFTATLEYLADSVEIP